MRILADLNRALCRVRPLWFLLVYLAAIPAYGVLYALAAPQGFRAVHAGDEAVATSGARSIRSMLEGALRRSLKDQSGQEFTVAGRKLDLDALRDSLRVDNARVTDNAMLSFRVRISATGIHDFEGERQLGWFFSVSVPELPSSAILRPSTIAFHRIPAADFSSCPPPHKVQCETLFGLVFGRENYGFGMRAPALTLSYLEDLQLRRYFSEIREAPNRVDGSVWHAMYVSARVMTALGTNGVVPVTAMAKALIASEAIAGIVLVALFLNSLACRAWERRE